MADLSRGPGARFAVVQRSPDVTDGLAARLADPLWMLARQWQFGEFRGDDAGSLVSMTFEADAHPPTWWRPEPDPAQPAAQPWQDWSVRSGPLEASLDAEPDDGTAWMRLRLDAGAAARRALCNAGLPAVAAALPRVAAWTPDQIASATGPRDHPDPRNHALMTCTAEPTALAATINDWADPGSTPPNELLQSLGVPDAAHDAFATAMRGWLQWWRDRATTLPTGQPDGPIDPPAWTPSRLEYRASLAFASAAGVQLQIDRHPGGQLDWHSADIVQAPPADTATAPDPPPDLRTPQPVTTLATPQPARLAGMPAARFWEFEDAQVDFGSIDASAADLARLLLVEYTTVYDHDWYLMPVRVPVGALVEVQRPIRVVDSFGLPTDLEPFAAKAAANTRMFNLTALPANADPQFGARWFWFPPRLAAVLESQPIEQVSLRRDETANLGWAIIDHCSDPTGRTVTVASQSTAAADIPPADPTIPRYTVESPLLTNWFPLVPTPLPASTAYMLVLTPQGRGTAPPDLPPGRLLAGPDWQIHEEELSPAGATLTRTRTLGRWHDGRCRLWTGRTAGAGANTPDSGLTWDYLRYPTPPTESLPQGADR
jgi:hypothetical protein